MNQENNARPPVFIVGVPRSGTTLLSAMLSSHSNMACGTETDFFHFLDQQDPSRLTETKSWPENAVKFLFDMVQTRAKSPVPENYGLSKEQVAAYLTDKSPSIAAMLGSVTEQFMRHNGKVRWVEKTPRHILYLPVIRRNFPDSPIIRIVRDPRDTALSILKASWGWAPDDFPGALSMWKYCDDVSSSFFQTDSNTLTVRYEDLILSPQSALENICTFIGEQYEDDMLKTSRSYQNVNSVNEAWKEKVAQPVDTSRIEVWRRELDEQQQLLTELMLGDRLKRYGYTHSEQNYIYASLWPQDGILSYPDTREWILKHQLRLWKRSGSEQPDSVILAGDPDTDVWLGHDTRSRLSNSLKLIRQMLLARLRGGTVTWFRLNQTTSSGMLAKGLTAIARTLGSIQTCNRKSTNALQWRVNFRIHPRLGILKNNPAS